MDDFMVYEDEGYATISVIRDGDYREAMTVEYSTTDDTAIRNAAWSIRKDSP